MKTEAVEHNGQRYILHHVDKSTRVAKPAESQAKAVAKSPEPKRRQKKHGPDAQRVA